MAILRLAISVNRVVRIVHTGSGVGGGGGDCPYCCSCCNHRRVQYTSRRFTSTVPRKVVYPRASIPDAFYMKRRFKKKAVINNVLRHAFFLFVSIFQKSQLVETQNGTGEGPHAHQHRVWNRRGGPARLAAVGAAHRSDTGT